MYTIDIIINQSWWIYDNHLSKQGGHICYMEKQKMKRKNLLHLYILVFALKCEKKKEKL